MRWTLLALVGCSYTPQPIGAPSGPDAPQLAPDAAPDAVVPPEQRCTMRYGLIDSFDLCSATETQCVFYARTNGANCKDTCEGRGGTCIQSHDGDCGGINTTDHNCIDGFGDQVCICTP